METTVVYERLLGRHTNYFRISGTAFCTVTNVSRFVGRPILGFIGL